MTREASEWLAENGFDPEFGARPLRRAVQRHLENPLSKGLLDGTFQEGDFVEVQVREGGLALTKRVLEAQPT